MPPLAQLGVLGVKPVFRQIQFGIHHRPVTILEIAADDPDLSQVDFAFPAQVLASCPCLLIAGALLPALVQRQHPTRQFWPLSDLGLDLVEDRVRRPWGVRHELLQALSILLEAHHAPFDVDEVAFRFQRQCAAQIHEGILAGVSRFGPETETETLPCPS